MVKTVRYFMSRPWCLFVGDGEISPRQAVGGAVTSRAMPALQLGNLSSWKQPCTNFLC